MTDDIVEGDIVRILSDENTVDPGTYIGTLGKVSDKATLSYNTLFEVILLDGSRQWFARFELEGVWGVR